MSLLPKLVLAGIVVSSLVVFYQDLKEKQISVWILCVFSTLVFAENFVAPTCLGRGILLNLLFCLFQFTVITLYFSLKERRFVKIHDSLFGWGDIWVILTLAFSFHWVNYIFFLTFGYTISLVLYILARIIFRNLSEKIPLAGMLCFLYALVKGIFFMYDISTFDEELIQSMLVKN